MGKHSPKDTSDGATVCKVCHRYIGTCAKKEKPPIDMNLTDIRRAINQAMSDSSSRIGNTVLFNPSIKQELTGR